MFLLQLLLGLMILGNVMSLPPIHPVMPEAVSELSHQHLPLEAVKNVFDYEPSIEMLRIMMTGSNENTLEVLSNPKHLKMIPELILHCASSNSIQDRILLQRILKNDHWMDWTGTSGNSDLANLRLLERMVPNPMGNSIKYGAKVYQMNVKQQDILMSFILNHKDQLKQAASRDPQTVKDIAKKSLNWIIDNHDDKLFDQFTNDAFFLSRFRAHEIGKAFYDAIYEEYQYAMEAFLSRPHLAEIVFAEPDLTAELRLAIRSGRPYTTAQFLLENEKFVSKLDPFKVQEAFVEEARKPLFASSLEFISESPVLQRLLTKDSWKAACINAIQTGNTDTLKRLLSDTHFVPFFTSLDVDRIYTALQLALEYLEYFPRFTPQRLEMLNLFLDNPFIKPLLQPFQVGTRFAKIAETPNTLPVLQAYMQRPSIKAMISANDWQGACENAVKGNNIPNLQYLLSEKPGSASFSMSQTDKLFEMALENYNENYKADTMEVLLNQRELVQNLSVRSLENIFSKLSSDERTALHNLFALLNGNQMDELFLKAVNGNNVELVTFIMEDPVRFGKVSNDALNQALVASKQNENKSVYHLFKSKKTIQEDEPIVEESQSTVEEHQTPRPLEEPKESGASHETTNEKSVSKPVKKAYVIAFAAFLISTLFVALNQMQ